MDRPPYVIRMAQKFSLIVADMVSSEDYAALFEFGNEINARAARRGLPHEESVAIVPKNLSPSDFEIEEGEGGETLCP